MNRLGRGAAVRVFLAFALAYFVSALLRAVTATLSPVLTAEFSLHAGDLGLLAGGYFLGFAAMQLPLGHWLDRYGPRKVNTALLAAAVLGCAVFALAQGLFWAGVAATFVMGIGTAITVAAIAVLAVSAKGVARRLAGGRDGGGALALRGLEFAAAILVLVLGVGLLSGYVAAERVTCF